MADDIPKFECDVWVRMPDSRWVAMVKSDKERPRDGGSGLKDCHVMINGKRYMCRGVERNMLAEDIRQGEKIGLLI